MDYILTPEEQREVNRLAAPAEVAFLIHLRDKSIEQSIAMGAWLVASLLILNTGGATALLSNLDRVHQPIVPGCMYLGGVIFALFNGWSIQKAGWKLAPIQEQIGYWMSVAEDGERNEALEAQHKTKARPIRIWGWIGSTAGWLSAILFAAASISMTVQIGRNSPTDIQSTPQKVEKNVEQKTVQK